MPHPLAESGVDSRGRLRQMRLKVFAFTQRERDLWMGWNWNQRSCYTLMPKKVCVMCFFLPQVHRHKAQAQFPSFNRVARVSLFCFFVLFKKKKMSQCKKQVGWPPPRFAQLTLDIYVLLRVITGCQVFFFFSFHDLLHCQVHRRVMLFWQEDTWTGFMQA